MIARGSSSRNVLIKELFAYVCAINVAIRNSGATKVCGCRAV